MHFLRFVALLLVVVIAYSAQFILHPPPLTNASSFLPAQVTAFLPDLARLRALLAGDIRDVAFFFMAVAAVTFGLLATPWSLTAPPLSPAPTTFLLASARRRHWLGWSVVIGALGLTIASGLLFRVQHLLHSSSTVTIMRDDWLLPASFSSMLVPLLQQAPWLPEALWATSLLLFFIGSAFFPWTFPQQAPEQPSLSVTVVKQPISTWPLLFLLLLLAGGLYSWQFLKAPLAVDTGVTQMALFAKDWLRNGESSFFLTGPELEPGVSFAWFATALTALLFRLTKDLLLSVRLAGLWAALLTIVATWLLGTELFRRVPNRLLFQSSEDQGQWPALLAALLVMFTSAMLLFSRLPVLLEAVAWGSLGCWALLRGLRTGDRLAVGLSGVLIGLSAIFYAPGFTFVLTALCWWGGYAVVQLGWLPHRPQPGLPASRFRGYFLLWIMGLVPTLGVRWLAVEQWLPPLQGSLRANWQPTLLSLGQQPDLSQLGGLAIPLLHDMVVPVLFLAVGALFFNFDRRVSWMLLTWLGSGLICAMILAPAAPLWPALLPIVPTAGLVLAFGLDRFRTTVFQTAGVWSRNLLNYLIMGLVLWVGINNSIEYYHFAQQQVDSVSALGQALRTVPAGRAVFVVAPPTVKSETPVLRFFTNDWETPSLATVTFHSTLLETLPAGAVILIAPADAAALALVQERHPNGELVVRRDHLANLLLYRYTLPE